MVKRRAKAAALPSSTCNHSFRATCITNFRKNGGSRGKAAQLAAHESERTTRLYDRRKDDLTVAGIERISINLTAEPRSDTLCAATRGHEVGTRALPITLPS
jgi:integrase